MCSATWPIHVPSASRLKKPPRRPSEQACSSIVGSSAMSASLKPGMVFDGYSLQDAQVHRHPDDRLLDPHVGSAQDARLEDAQGRRCTAPLAHRAWRLGRRRWAWWPRGLGPVGFAVTALLRPGLCGVGLGRRHGVPASRGLAGSAGCHGVGVQGAQHRRRHPDPPSQVEPIARRQRVQDHVADHDRAVRAHLPCVRLGCLAIDDGHAPTADDLHDHVRRRPRRRCPRRCPGRAAPGSGRWSPAAGRAGCAAGSAGRR